MFLKPSALSFLRFKQWEFNLLCFCFYTSWKSQISATKPRGKSHQSSLQPLYSLQSPMAWGEAGIITPSSWWELPLGWAGAGSHEVIVFTAGAGLLPELPGQAMSGVAVGICVILSVQTGQAGGWHVPYLLHSLHLPKPCSSLPHSPGTFSSSLLLTAAHHPPPICFCAADQFPGVFFSEISSQMWAIPNAGCDPWCYIFLVFSSSDV